MNKLYNTTANPYNAEYIMLFLNLASASILRFDKLELLNTMKKVVAKKNNPNELPDNDVSLITILNEYILFEKNHVIR